MKRKFKFVKDPYQTGCNHVEYKDDLILVEYYDDGSGIIEVAEGIEIFDEGTHASRIQELKQAISLLTKALKRIKSLGNPREALKKFEKQLETSTE